MFTVPKPNLIESDKGFSVEVLGRTGLLYREANGTYFIDSEVVLGPSGLAIYSSSIRYWESLPGDEPISVGKRAAIVANIRDAFRFQGYEIDVC